MTDPDQAAVIADPERSRFLGPFLGRESTVTQAAAQVGCSPNAMLYRVRRMLALDILTVVREVRRAGRAVKIYRAAHDGYFVPTEVMHYDDVRHRVATYGRALVTGLIDSYTAVLADAELSGRILVRQGGRVWGSDLLPEHNRRGQPAHFADAVVHLTQQEAEQVRDLLSRVEERSLCASRPAYDGSGRTSPDGRQPYLVVGAILPTSSH